MIIQQTQEEAKLAFQFQMNAEISAIRLMTASVKRAAINRDEQPESLEAGLGFRTGPHKLMPGFANFSVQFKFRIRTPNPPVELAFINCEYDVEYEIKKDFTPEEEQMKAFHGGNVIFACWPYFRELVQSATSRMGLPPAVIPFLRLMPKVASPKVIDAKAESTAPQKQIAAGARAKSFKKKEKTT